MSDIDTVVVNSLKTLDPNRPIREADIHAFGSAEKNGSASCQDAACRVDYLDFGVVSSLSTPTPGTDVLPVP